MTTSHQAALHLEMKLRQHEEQLQILDQQGRAYNAGARRFLQRKMQFIRDQIAASNVAEDPCLLGPPP